MSKGEWPVSWAGRRVPEWEIPACAREMAIHNTLPVLFPRWKKGGTPLAGPGSLFVLPEYGKRNKCKFW